MLINQYVMSLIIVKELLNFNNKIIYFYSDFMDINKSKYNYSEKIKSIIK